MQDACAETYFLSPLSKRQEILSLLYRLPECLFGQDLAYVPGSSVHLLTAAKKDWAPQLLATTEPIKQEGVQEVAHLVPLVKEKNSEKEMKMQAEWIRKYMVSISNKL